MERSTGHVGRSGALPSDVPADRVDDLMGWLPFAMFLLEGPGHKVAARTAPMGLRAARYRRIGTLTAARWSGPWRTSTSALRI